jgi:Domain of Unknown Function (DUF1206)
MSGFGAIERLARVGFLVKGVLYMVIGALALQVAARAGGRVTGTRGALTAVLGQPFGRTLLLVAAIGLLGHAAWRVLQGLFDPDRLGHDWRGLAIRASFVARGVVHAVLGRQAFRLYRGLSASSGTSECEVATEAFRWPLGDWLVVLAGLSLIGFAAQQVYAAITCRLERNLDVEEMGNRRRRLVPRSVGSRHHGVVIPHARCTTGRAGPLASGRNGSGLRRLRLLRDHPCALSTYPTRPVRPHP